MLAVAQINYIRHEVNQKGETYAHVARKMEVDPRTVKKYANQEEFKKKEKQKGKYAKLKDMDLDTGRAYRMKLSLQNMFTRSSIISELYFNEWYNWTIRSQLEPMIKLAQSLKRHEKGILKWFETKMTNGLLEGINSLVQASKRKARGYHSPENFIAMIYATVNKLEFIEA